MTIIKHGNPKERIYFICPECGCEWRARVAEADQLIVGGMLLYCCMDCPDCGCNTKERKQ